MLSKVLKQAFRLKIFTSRALFSRNQFQNNNQDFDLDDEFADDNSHSLKQNKYGGHEGSNQRNSGRYVDQGNTDVFAGNSRNYQDRNRNNYRKSGTDENNYNNIPNFKSEYESRTQDQGQTGGNRSGDKHYNSGYGSDDQQNYQKSNNNRGMGEYNREGRNNYPHRRGEKETQNYNGQEKGGKIMDHSDEPFERDYSKNYQRSEGSYRYQENNNTNSYYNQDQPKQQRWKEDGYRPNKDYNPSDPARNTRSGYQRNDSLNDNWNGSQNQNKLYSQNNQHKDTTKENLDEPYVQAVYYRREIRYQTMENDEDNEKQISEQRKSSSKNSKGENSGNKSQEKEATHQDNTLEKNSTTFSNTEGKTSSKGTQQSQTSQASPNSTNDQKGTMNSTTTYQNESTKKEEDKTQSSSSSDSSNSYNKVL